jgi:hypothetical protein
MPCHNGRRSRSRKPPRRQSLETAYRTLIVDFVTRPASLRCAGTESM